MNRQLKKRHLFKKVGISLTLCLCLCVVMAMFGCSESAPTNSNNGNVSTNTTKTSTPKTESDISVNEPKNTLGKLEIHYINVGQGDCALIKQGDHNMLIDAGTNASANGVVEYLRKQNVKQLEYVIGTHPHEDHIGGLDKVIDAFDIGTVIMPKATANTKTFKDVVTSLKNKNLKITLPHVGDNYKLGNANFTILAPNKNSYNNTNDYSVVSRLRFGNNSFIFTGDAEALSEGEILQKQLDISSDVLKIGHHGSRTSTTQSFLDKVNPKYAVISCGIGNKYGHPTQETLSKLKAKNIKLYRTDECKTVIATSDGENITFNCKEGSFKAAPIGAQPKSKPTLKKSNVSKVVPAASSSSTKAVHTGTKVSTTPVSQPAKSGKQVWLSATGSKYHSKPNCGRMNPSKARQVSIEEAQNEGYSACSKCMY